MDKLAGGPGNFSTSSGLFNFRPNEGESRSNSEERLALPVLLAQALEGDPQGPLSRWLRARPDQGLRDAWDRALNPDDRQKYENLFGAEGVASLLALAGEADRGLLGEGLLSLAKRLRDSDHSDGAALLYQAVQALQISTSLNQRAAIRIDALQGKGSAWDRIDFFTRRVVKEATDPSAIFSMGVAGLVGKAVRLGVLGRLAASEAGFFTRGIGARGLATVASLAVEAPAFTASARGMNELLGRNQDWSARGVWHEFASGATTLVGLKASGAIGGSLVKRFAQRESLLARAGQVLIPQAAMIGGIHASHWAEQKLGLRPPSEGALSVADTLGTWLQFNIAGSVSRHVLGEGFHRFEMGMEQRSESIVAQNEYVGGLTSALSSRLVRGAPLAASMAACLAGCDVGTDHSRGTGLLAILVGGLGAFAMSRGSGQNPRDVNASATTPRRGDFSHQRSMDIELGSISLEMNAQGHQPIADRTMSSYENALRNLLEGSEDGFATLQGDYAERIRTNPDLRKRLLAFSEVSPNRRMKASIGPGGHLIDFEILETIGMPFEESGKSFPHSRSARISIGSGSLVLEARGHQAIADRTMENYGNALRDLLEGTEDDFARLSGDIAEQIRSDSGLRDRLVAMNSGVELGRDRRIVVGPGGQLLAYQLKRSLAALPETEAANPHVAGQTHGQAAIPDESKEFDVARRSEFRAEPSQETAPKFSGLESRLSQIQALDRAEKNKAVVRLWREVAPQQSFSQFIVELAKETGSSPIPKSYAVHIDNLLRHWPGSESEARALFNADQKVRRWMIRERFLTTDRKKYSESTIANMLPWVSFVWENADLLGLPVSRSNSEPDAEASPSVNSPIPDITPPPEEPISERFEATKAPLDSNLIARMEAIRDLGRGDRMQALFQLWNERKSGKSFRSFVDKFISHLDERNTHTISSNATFIDLAIRRWAEWQPHLRILSETNQGRLRLARQLLRKPQGEAYEAHSIPTILGWGLFVWQNRSRLGLPDSTSLQVGDYEGPIALQPRPDSLSQKIHAAEAEPPVVDASPSPIFEPEPRQSAPISEDSRFVALGPELKSIGGLGKNNERFLALFQLWRKNFPERGFTNFLNEASRFNGQKNYMSSNQSAFFDSAFRYWRKWMPGIQKISEAMPALRLKIARESLIPDGGMKYSDGYLRLSVPLAVLMWENRIPLGLEEAPRIDSEEASAPLSFNPDSDMQAKLASHKIQPELAKLVLSLAPRFLQQTRPHWQNLFEIWHSHGRDFTFTKFSSAVDLLVLEQKTDNIANIFNYILPRWSDLSPKIEEIQTKPSKAQLGSFRSLLRRDHQSFKFDNLQLLRDVGIWLWQNRTGFGLEPSAPIEESPAPVSTSAHAMAYEVRIQDELERLEMAKGPWLNVRARAQELFEQLRSRSSAPRPQEGANLFLVLRTRAQGAPASEVLKLLEVFQRATEGRSHQHRVYKERTRLEKSLRPNRLFFQYRGRIQNELQELSRMESHWREIGARAQAIFDEIESSVTQAPQSPFAPEYLFRLLSARKRNAEPREVSQILTSIEGEVRGSFQNPRVNQLLDSLDNALALKGSEPPALMSSAENLSTAAASASEWFHVRERLSMLRDPANFEEREPQDIAEARRLLDTIERLETHSTLTPYDADHLLDRFEDAWRSGTPDLEPTHQQRRAMVEQTQVLRRLQEWKLRGASNEALSQAHRVFQSFFHPIALSAALLAEASKALVQICDADLSSENFRIALDGLEQRIGISEKNANSPTEFSSPPTPPIETPLDLASPLSFSDAMNPEIEITTLGNSELEVEVPASEAEPPPSRQTERAITTADLESSLQKMTRKEAVQNILDRMNELYIEASPSKPAITLRHSQEESRQRIQTLRSIARRLGLSSEPALTGKETPPPIPGVSRQQRRAALQKIQKAAPTLDQIFLTTLTTLHLLSQSQDILHQTPTASPTLPVKILSPSEERVIQSEPVANLDSESSISVNEAEPKDTESNNIVREVEASVPSHDTESLPEPSPPLPLTATDLVDLLGQRGNPEMIRIERYLDGDEGHQRLAIPPSIERLIEICRELRNLSSPNIETLRARDAWISKIGELIQGPSEPDIVAFTRANLPMSPSAQRVYEGLTAPAREGLYLLTIALRGENRKFLAAYLERSPIPRASQVLELIARLHYRGVRGYENGFVPSGWDDKFLSDSNHRFSSLLKEYRQVLRLADMTHVRRLWVGPRLTIDWNRLSLSEKQAVESEVLPQLDHPYRYELQQSAEVDAYYQTQAGQRRIVEIKTYSAEMNLLEGDEWAGIVLQAYRHSLLVRQHNLEGVEYILEAPTVSPAFTSMLRQQLEKLGTPYIIRVHNAGDDLWHSYSRGMDPSEDERPTTFGYRLIPLVRRHSLPVSAPDQLSDQSSLPWSDAMVEFINLGLDKGHYLSKRRTREEVLYELSHAPSPLIINGLETWNAFIREHRNEFSASSARRLEDLMGQLRFRSGDVRTGRSKVSLLLQIAALATMTETEHVEPNEDPNTEFQTFLQHHGSVLENWLNVYEQSLAGIDDLAKDMSSEDLRNLLDEHSPDNLIEATQHASGRGGWSLRRLSQLLQLPLFELQGRNYGDRIGALLEHYETLRSSLDLRDSQPPPH